MESYGQETSYCAAVSCYLFEDLRLSVNSRELTCHGQPIAIENKALDFLIYLIQNRERAVSKQELHEILWHNRPLSETVMARCVMKVRRAINDNGQRQSIIKTIPGYGYRFVADTDIENRLLPKRAKIAIINPLDYHPRNLGNRIYLYLRNRCSTLLPSINGIGAPLHAWIYNAKHLSIIATLLLLIFTSLLYIQESTISHTGPSIELAVMPVKNSTGDDSLNWIEFGLMTIIGRSLSSYRGIRTIPFQATMPGLTTDQTTLMGHHEMPAVLRHSETTRNSYLIETILQRENGLFRLNYTIHIPDSPSLSGSLVGEDPLLLAGSVVERLVAQLRKNAQSQPD